MLLLWILVSLYFRSMYSLPMEFQISIAETALVSPRMMIFLRAWFISRIDSPK